MAVKATCKYCGETSGCDSNPFSIYFLTTSVFFNVIIINCDADKVSKCNPGEKQIFCFLKEINLMSFRNSSQITAETCRSSE